MLTARRARRDLAICGDSPNLVDLRSSQRMRQSHNVEAERRACKIRLRAERKAGELSAKLQKSEGGRPSKTRATMDRVSTKAEQLQAAGVTPRQAKQWEKLAAVPEKEFKQALADPSPSYSHTAGACKKLFWNNHGTILPFFAKAFFQTIQ